LHVLEHIFDMNV